MAYSNLARLRVLNQVILDMNDDTSLQSQIRQLSRTLDTIPFEISRYAIQNNVYPFERKPYLETTNIDRVFHKNMGEDHGYVNSTQSIRNYGTYYIPQYGGYNGVEVFSNPMMNTLQSVEYGRAMANDSECNYQNSLYKNYYPQDHTEYENAITKRIHGQFSMDNEIKNMLVTSSQNQRRYMASNTPSRNPDTDTLGSMKMKIAPIKIPLTPLQSLQPRSATGER